MNISFVGKNAFVCGSTQGIGFATAMELARKGASVTLISRTESSLEKAMAQLPKSDGQSHGYIVADFSNPASLRQALLDWRDTNSTKVHILINNTGGPAGGPAHRADIDEFRQAFNQHLVCNQILAQFVLPDMKEAAFGRIINVISTSVKQPLNNLGVSNTIRGAVANWAKTLANELGGLGITVNNVLPGATETARLKSIIANKAAKSGSDEASVANSMKSIIPAGRFAQPEEIAYAISFLASDLAAYINGVNLPVDGGRTKSL